MLTIRDYQQRAQEVLELAERARPTERPTLIKIAESWIKLAEEREAELRLLDQEPPR